MTCFDITDYHIAPDKDWKQSGIYPPLLGLIGYFKLGISSFFIGYPSVSNEAGPQFLLIFCLLTVSKLGKSVVNSAKYI